MGIARFRRFPALEIENTWGRVGKILAPAFRSLDRGGVLSDAIADPRTAFLAIVPRKLVNWFHRSGGPLVSVIVATRNNAATLEESISSLLGQTHDNIEILIIDDASSDG